MKRHVLTSFAAIAALALTFAAAQAQQSGRDQPPPAAGAGESRGGSGEAPRARDKAPSAQSGQKTTGQGERAGERSGGQPSRAQSGPPDEMPPTSGQKAGQADSDRGRGDQDRAKGAQKGDRGDGAAKTRQSRDRDQQNQSGRKGDRTDRDRAGRDSRDRDGRDRGERTTTQEREPRGTRERSTQERRGTTQERARTGADDARREGRESRESRESTRERDRDARGSASMSQEQRTRVSERFSARIESMNVRPLSRTNIRVSVGVSIPRSVTLYDVPRDVVTIYPQYRGHRFVVVEDEIVIIEPRSRRVVATLPHGGARAASSTATRSSTTGMRQGGIRLSDSQRQVIRTTIMREPRCRTETRIDFVLFVPLPRSVEVCEFPPQLVSDLPEMGSYRFVMRGDEIVIVDPTRHEVVEIIE